MDFPSNRCYMTFLSCDEARLTFQHVASLPLAGSGFKTELLQSRNVSDSDINYIPNVFDNHLENYVPEVRQIPPPRWFVAYYIHRRGNFIHAYRYLAKEIGTIPEGNLKKYFKGVLVRAKDITQARMLQHLSCPTGSMFETVKAHPIFNYSKGVYSQDLYEFLEEEILAMCPSSVKKVTKMRNSSNMVLLTFFGSILPDRVHIGPINLRVRSRQCLRYRLEQDILKLANSQFISLGSARSELLYRQQDGTGVTSYASLAARSSAESVGSKTIPSATSHSVGAGGPVRLANRFALLFDDSVESSVRSDGNNPDLTKVTHVVDVHLPPASPKPLKGLTKWHRLCGVDRLNSAKVSPGAHDRESSRDRSAKVTPMVSVQPFMMPSVSDRASRDEDVISMESSDDIVTTVPRGPTVSKCAVQPDPRPLMTGRGDDGSHHSPVGRKAAVLNSHLQASTMEL
ncbi:hypothetical protein E2C01_029388 [Portunus trituberculatus]|uniref:Uncharacterized protein n=1 Tax=Portunus trituberculatus TaxID=210409 RepID=A0A5B7ERP9_PORTR|nr:hypothetical protein [Portunus trituberculatus]